VWGVGCSRFGRYSPLVSVILRGTLARKPPASDRPTRVARCESPSPRGLLRSVALVPLYETFLVSAVVSLLAVRAGLALSGFPQLGGGGLHIAHMLWGGLLMLLSLLLLFGFVGRAVQFTAAMVSGIGFGTFIDEIGKFVTSDNDYFFRPAVALIYAVFVLLSLLARALEPRRVSPAGALRATPWAREGNSPSHPRRPPPSAEVPPRRSRQESGAPRGGAPRQPLEIGLSDPPLLPGPFRRLQRRAARFYL